MARTTMADQTIPPSVLAASGVVGSWAYDHRSGCLSLSADFAGLVGHDPASAARGLPLDTFLDRAHLDDRDRIESYFHAVAAAGGPVEIELRLYDPRGGLHTLLLCGRIERDAGRRAARGCGIAIDRTEVLTTDLMQPEQIVNRMAEHVIALRSLAETLGRPALFERVNGLMIEIGYELARFLARTEIDIRH